MSSGFASAWATASLVISWNRTRRTLPPPPLPSWLATCHAMASPSRSGSVASSTRSDALAAFLISARVLAFSLMVTYSGVKPFSTSTPSLRCGRSRTCLTVAFTVYPAPRYFPMVLALVGDSTTTSAPTPGLRPGLALPRGGAPGLVGSAALRRLRTFTTSTTSTSFTTVFLAATHQSFVKRHESASLPSCTRLRKPDDLGRHLRRRAAIDVDLRVRVAVQRLALLQELAHPGHGVLSH